MAKKLTKRLHILNEVSNASSGPECGIGAATSRDLVESVLRYGLATAGARIITQELRRVRAAILNSGEKSGSRKHHKESRKA